MTSAASPAPRGLDGVVAGETRLSHVDGLSGRLIIGGYSVEDLAGRVTFEEAAHLLWKGALPSLVELNALTSAMGRQRELPESILQVVRAAAKASPIDALRTNVEFYTALVLQAIGLEPRQFAAMFACGRVAG